MSIALRGCDQDIEVDHLRRDCEASDGRAFDTARAMYIRVLHDHVLELAVYAQTCPSGSSTLKWFFHLGPALEYIPVVVVVICTMLRTFH